MNAPIVFVHAEFIPQGVPVVHSLTSLQVAESPDPEAETPVPHVHA